MLPYLLIFSGSGGWIRTNDLWGMIPINFKGRYIIGQSGAFTICIGYSMSGIQCILDDKRGNELPYWY